LVRQLHRGDFMDSADNVVLIGGPGTGKSHIATALGVQAVEHHRRKVRFFATVDLVNALEQEKAANKAGQLAERLLKLDLIILDELGYLPFSPSGGALLFHLLSKLYGKRCSGPTLHRFMAAADAGAWMTRRLRAHWTPTLKRLAGRFGGLKF
jgi:DNA replication protein DnaC